MCLRFCVTLVLVNAVIISGFKNLSQKPTTEFWDEKEQFEFGYTGPPSPDLRLPSDVVPSFYRLKLKTDLEKSVFKGEVYITIKANKDVKEIILHSKGLSISQDAKLTEQIYEEVKTLHRSKRQAPETESIATPVSTENVTAGSDVPLSTDAPLTSTDSSIANSTAPEKEVTISSNTTEIPLVTNTTLNETVLVNEIPLNDAPTNSTEQTTEGTIYNYTEYAITPMDTQVTHSAARNIKILSINQGSGDRLIITLASALKPDVDYILELTFEGNISDAMTGFYKSTYTNSDQEVRNLGVTQFEPTSARAAFPCFDEPAFKAMFEISIAHLANLTALSNMKVSSEENILDAPGWKWTHFERSVNMSTYLVAYIVSDFAFVETSYVSKDNVTKPIRVWTRPELINKANYALSITPKLLDYYEDVFGVPYALDKLDLVAVPDFSSGAMENWGLVTFRETTLLFDTKDSVPRDKQNVGIDVAHELAHQWFGNLVTMRWWTDLWLNEGFATYIEYVGVDHIEPEWNMFESFSIDKMDLLRSDALKNTSPVSRKVIDASEISQKFDEISYTKGANLIRMLNHTISQELFYKGLLIYLNDWKYTNAEENDLWVAMSKATESAPGLGGLSVVEFMNSWTRQAGYPVVNVRRDYATGEVTFEQKLFTSSNDPYQAMVDQIWHIPISYAAMDAAPSTWSAAPNLWLKGRSATAPVPVNATQALYVNVDAIGYYRVNYDKRNWELLSSALKAGYFKSPITKAQLIDDAFNLAKSAQLNYSQALGLTTCVIDGEDSKIVWDLLLNNMGFLKHNIRKTSGYVYFQDYMKIILKKQLQRLNYGLSQPKDDNEAFLVESLVMWECEVEGERCLRWARKEFDAWAENPYTTNNSIPAYLRSLVYNMALKHGGRREFDLLWEVFQNASDPNVKNLLISNLPSTRDEALITLLLEKSLNDLPNQYASSVWSVDPSVGARVAQDFLVANFDAVYDRFTKMDEFTFPSILNGAFGFITTSEELDKFKAFASQHKEKLIPMSQTLQKIADTAALRIRWVGAHAKEVTAWLKNYVTNNQTSTTNGTLDKTVTPNSNGNITELSDAPASDVTPTVAPTNDARDAETQNVKETLNDAVPASNSTGIDSVASV